VAGEEQGNAYYAARVYRATQRDLLKAVEGLSEEQLRDHPGHTNSIAFDLWHVGRWADHLGSILSEMTPDIRRRVGVVPEIWTVERLIDAWGFPAGRLGHVDTGMTMPDETAAALQFPPKDVLLDYVRRSFGQAQRVVNDLLDSDLLQPAQIVATRVPWLDSPSEYGTPLTWVLAYARHDARHLGMIEALKGVAGMRGTATV
jgi:DinB family protein